ncbi:poly-gamma-glutamate synthase PgsB [Alteribacillus sp. YIM 98480]|uniref:poly-gamma-glutamate synthase PgsB n=1 Tax=Alteribacillus sp. YIM 98480 TaxID=2606599 RepID=UPI00131EB7CA|nr:poly-gamma-glutamate synthase PgsB [Alteribacillus sp. YIM 98480]
MLLILMACAILCYFGYQEKRKHQKEIDTIPVRVNVNGIRGKSTVTRLITGVLTEAGYKTFGKTTGTSARLIDWQRQETPIVRRLEGPNIKEQKTILQQVSAQRAEAFVSECMAINPEYQDVLQKHFLQANIGVILNVYEDHMDVMGPTLQHVADGFASTIPYDGTLITTDGPFYSYFYDIAQKRNTEVICADPNKLPEGFIHTFDYMIFPENAAVALAVAESLNIDKETALKGMLNANPDPGALKITAFKDGAQKSSYFINSFAANDAHSTLSIWERIKSSEFMTEHPIVIMNCREDRVDRTKDFSDNVLPHLHGEKLILIGKNVHHVLSDYEKGNLPFEKVINLEGTKPDAVLDRVINEANHATIFGIGNIHGAGEAFINALQSSPNILDSNKVS